MLSVIYHAELAGGYAVDLLTAVDDVGIVARRLHRGLMPLGGVANLERNAPGQRALGEIMEVMHGEILLVGGLRVVAVGDIQDVVPHVFLYHKPWASAESQALALPDGVKPQTLVLAYPPARLKLNHIAGVVAEITLDVFIIVYLAKETDALRVLSLCVDEMFAFGYGAHLVFHIMPDGKEGFL